ncbi:zinc-dependent metalloprotease [Micropruina sp.]|uniref:zinc-dependent metalloprotease n=1 Tax=Micropruina sp. TaxID=2737536 RepID=UPI0039E21492
MSAVPGIDWRLAADVGEFLVHPGVAVDRAEAAGVVADLRVAAERAVEAVASASLLPAPRSSEVLVVGRETWVRAATQLARTMFEAAGQQPASSLGAKVGARLAGAQLGGAFAFVATRILGQFDPYTTPGRLLLVAPNIVAAERSMGVEPHGFRQWVCLHEQTHRAQFEAAPWLAAHLVQLTAELFADADEPGQAGALDEITATMSLLEGHAEVMMDRAAPRLVPQVQVLRAAMEAHRDAFGPVQLLSRLLGLRAKREQYRHGAAFCRAVIDRAGLDTLNLAFSAAELLPHAAELHDAEQWLRRVPARVG